MYSCSWYLEQLDTIVVATKVVEYLDLAPGFSLSITADANNINPPNQTENVTGQEFKW